MYVLGHRVIQCNRCVPSKEDDEVDQQRDEEHDFTPELGLMNDEPVAQ